MAIRPAFTLPTRCFHRSQQAFNLMTTTAPTSDATPAVLDTKSVEATVRDAPKSLDVDYELADGSISQKKIKLKMERTVHKELQYLNNDPWKVTEYVKKALKRGKFDEAHLLVQTGSKTMQLVVPWNLLMDHLLNQQQVKRAIKLLNEMKKRAQFPNAQTYTILFRGLAKSQHPKTAVFEAVKHYNALLKDSRLEPNSTHLNAVLNVCNRAGDMDSMFSIVDTLNESTRSPTSYTYTTVLNALRYNTLDGMDELTPEQKEYNVNNGIQRGKAIWSEVTSKWRQGRLVIDEELVCSMGRLMLMSTDLAGKREILDLVEKTMNIPNLSKVQGMSAEDARKQDARTGEAVKKDNNGVYANPGNNTLSLLLQVVYQAKLSSLGIKYWNFIIRQYGLEPDRDCWMRLFAILKQAKASGHTTEILDIIPKSINNARFYRMAMETCVRDNINPNVNKNADRALDSMMNNFKVPDPHTMRLYLNVAQTNHFHLRARAEKGDVAGSKRDYGMQITNALDRLWVPYRRLHDHYFKHAKAITDEQKGVLYNEQREVIALARIMYGSFNKVIQQEMLPNEDLEKIRSVGGRINREINDFFANREEREPNLRRTRGRGTAEEDMSANSESMNMGQFWDTTRAGQPKNKPFYRDPQRRHDEDSHDTFNESYVDRWNDGPKIRRTSPRSDWNAARDDTRRNRELKEKLKKLQQKRSW
ncbi:Pentatricopeptide repeat-containing protein C18H10.11c [Fusarium austroafricanum]|uniref:Pentatricopeptide repeat-containing protein C18H10.11c n=1 Tax=Fusarium austroafricanum TaxID=2364996 RepID=A0A8H4K2G0_9HYPO|nr:Pentatricopeptide repeat-containing protein C18H10.11c [Fusarium austroafricanum]